jgi:P-type conjugative transfer ATPase TrbB
MDLPEPSAVDTSLERRVRMLRTAMGPEIAAALNDPEVVEVLLNPDGSLWVDRLGTGREATGAALAPAVAERIIRLVAAHVRTEVHSGAPILSAELPETGERFLGVLPPVVRAPSFAIRKRALRIMTLANYVADGVMTEDQAEFLRRAVRERLNIVVAGGTSTGKTTLANALLDEMAETGDRVLIFEDTVELQCRSDDQVSLRTEPGVVTMTDLLRATLRLRPDRIIVGEVRGPEALDLLKAWGTGHPGGIATVHAGSAHGALTRLEQLVQEVSVTVPRALIAEAVNVIVFIAGRGRARRVREIARIVGHDSHGYRFARLRRRLVHAVGSAAAVDPRIDRGTGGQDRRRDHHHRHRPDPGVRRHLRRRRPPDPDRVRPVDRVRRELLLPELLQLWWRGIGLMDAGEPIAGYYAPVHRSLTEQILLGGAPRARGYRQRHAGRCGRPRAAALACRARALGDRPLAGGLGGEARSQFVDVPAGTSATPISCACEGGR